jgi:hypothetical protein
MYATDATYLNDSQEVLYAMALAKKYFKNRPSLRGFRPILETLDLLALHLGAAPAYIASFSEESDILSQWRGYCSKGPGFALCLSPAQMTKVTKAHDWVLCKCIYDEEQQVEVLKKMEECAHNHDDLEEEVHTVALALLRFGTALKHPKFEEESEWRVIQQVKSIASIRPGTSLLLPYIDFPLTIGPKDPVELSRLVVGPTAHASLAQRAVRRLLQKTSTICPEPVSSEIPFRNW